MKNRIREGLSLRLFIVIYAIMVLSFGLYTYQIIKRHRADLMESVHTHSYRIGDCIKRSTRYGMLLNQKEDVQTIVSNLINEPGVDDIIIYDKSGLAAFSSKAEMRYSSISVDNSICQACHSNTVPSDTVQLAKRTQIIQKDNKRILSVLTPIPNEPSCYTAVCHAHAPDEKVLGVMDVHMSLATVDEQIKESRKGFVSFAIYITLGIAFLFGFFIYFGVRGRIQKLIEGTEQLAAGNLDHRISIKGHDEIGQLATSFNQMTLDLKKAKEEITNWSNSLEEKVEEKQTELERAQDHLIRIEKLASLGKLSAVVAHEINNPLAGSLNYTMLVLRILKNQDFNDERKEKVQEYLNIVTKEISRVGDIIKNMLIFAKQTGGEFTEEYVHNLINSAEMLVNHQMELKQISLEMDLDCTDDLVVWNTGLIRQALVALFINAIEAMDEGGKLTVRSSCDSEEELVKIEIQDSGCGIPKDIIQNIFDPFFSTKQEGKGVGLGLSIVYGIIEGHKGKIWVESEESNGTTFHMEIPTKPNVDADVKIDPNLKS